MGCLIVHCFAGVFCMDLHRKGGLEWISVCGWFVIEGWEAGGRRKLVKK